VSVVAGALLLKYSAFILMHYLSYEVVSTIFTCLKLWAMSHLGMLTHQKISDFKGLLSTIELKLSTGSPDDLFFLFESLVIARRSIIQMTKEKNEVTPASSHSEEELDDEDSKSLVAMVPDIILLCDQVIIRTADQLL